MSESRAGQILKANPYLIDAEVLAELNRSRFQTNRADLRTAAHLLNIAPADRQTQRQLVELVIGIKSAIARHLIVRERGIAAGNRVRVDRGIRPAVTAMVVSVHACGFVYLAHMRGAYNPRGITVISNKPI